MTVAVQHQIVVRRAVEDTFRIFTEEMSRWWPFAEGYSFGGDRFGEIVLEARAGGRLFERFRDGEEFDIGTVLAYEPPSRVAYTWKNPTWDAPTEVEVRFTADGEGTRVEVEHRGFERIGALAEQAERSYGSGWPAVLAHFTRYAGRNGASGLPPA